MIRVFSYARFSSDLQNEKSNADQLRENREYAVRQDGWAITREFSDAAISGTARLPGFEALRRAAYAGECDVVLAEALDRLSRDQEDTAALFKRLSYVGVRIFTVNYGELTAMHVGLLGTMAALFLKDLAQKTSRGLRGKTAGGLAFGYRYDRSRMVTDRRGTLIPEKGVLVIQPEEAAVVLRILKLYAAGMSPENIAKLLNKETVPGPRGRKWNPSTIYGNWRRGIGILNNELYIGFLVWNRQRFIKNPDTRKRIARLNPPEQWTVKELQHLRIPGLTDDLWQAVKARHAETRKVSTTIETRVRARRPKFLFSGLTKCGVCGAGYNLSSRETLRCFSYEKRGNCTNGRTITRQELEGRVLHALQKLMMSDAAVAEFYEGVREEQNRQRMEERERLAATNSELARVKHEIRGLIDAIKAGVPGAELKAEMEGLQARKNALDAHLESLKQPEPLLHTGMGAVYRKKIAQLVTALESADVEERESARSEIRVLITKIVIPAGDAKLQVEGNLGEMLAVAASGPDRSTLAAVAHSGCGGGI